MTRPGGSLPCSVADTRRSSNCCEHYLGGAVPEASDWLVVFVEMTILQVPTSRKQSAPVAALRSFFHF